MRELTKCERMTMLVFGADYAKSSLSAIDYYARLSDGRKAEVRRWVNEILEAPFDEDFLASLVAKGSIICTAKFTDLPPSHYDFSAEGEEE